MSPDVCCVTDTNVWIDLRVGNLLTDVFELEAKWMIPDLVGRELGPERKQMLVKRGLEVRSLTGDEIEAVVRLNENYAAPSRTDMATLVVARAENGILVTGDGALRAAAQKEDVEVHGSLWVVDALVATHTVATPRAAQALQRMMASDRRLPKNEVNRRINDWHR